MPRTGRDDPGMVKGREFEIWPLGRLFSPVADGGLFVQNTIPGDSVRDDTQFWRISSRVRLLCRRRRLEEKRLSMQWTLGCISNFLFNACSCVTCEVIDAVGKQISCTVISINNLLLYQTMILSADKRSLYDGLTITCGVIMRRADGDAIKGPCPRITSRAASFKCSFKQSCRRWKR